MELLGANPNDVRVWPESENREEISSRDVIQKTPLASNLDEVESLFLNGTESRPFSEAGNKDTNPMVSTNLLLRDGIAVRTNASDGE
jgi:hypothetical protein